MRAVLCCIRVFIRALQSQRSLAASRQPSAAARTDHALLILRREGQLRCSGTESSLTLRWRKTDSNSRSLSGEEGDRTTPSLASNDFHGSKHPNGQSKTAEAAVVKQQFDSVWARADTALTASAFF